MNNEYFSFFMCPSIILYLEAQTDVQEEQQELQETENEETNENENQEEETEIGEEGKK
jgi:hypothetical protein